MSLLVVLLTACGGTRTIVRTAPAPISAARGDERVFGHVRSLAPVRDGYLLHFDPALLLTGVTANAAVAADQGIRCRPTACPPVPNDNYVVDEGHRTFVYVLPSSVHGTILTKKAQGPFPPTRITAAQLAQLVEGRSSLKLFEPLTTGVWIRVHIDTVRDFAQQYVP